MSKIISVTIAIILLALITILMSGISANISGQNKVNSTAQEHPLREKCYKCHEESVEYKEWETSEHATALVTLKKSDRAQNSCLRCHSSGYVINASVWGSRRFIKITLETAQNAVACSSCHRHGAKSEHNLTTPPKKLCVSCHRMYCG